MARILTPVWMVVALLLVPSLTVPPLAAQSVAADAAAFEQGRVVSGPAAVLPLRHRVGTVNEILRSRLQDLLPGLMREAGIDLWLVINRELAEDPVYFTLVPEPVFAARRTTMLVFFDRGPEEGVERLTVNRYPLADLYEPAWEGGDVDQQWQRLGELIAERQPRVIGIDTSSTWPVADGLTASLEKRLLDELPGDLAARVVSAEELVVRWLETRSERELELYPHIVGLVRGVIAEAFSSRVIMPGVTTTDDVAWFMRQRFAEQDLDVWFMPDVNVQRRGSPCAADDPFCGESPSVILPGDVLHTDVGICYLRLCTDTQEMGYVLKPGEETMPAGLASALAAGNRFQDLLTVEFVAGRSGNEILRAALDSVATEGLAASIYSHPIGFFGHAPGPTIGMWDNQGPTPERGDWLLHPVTAYAIEGNAKVAVPEWDGQLVQIKLEQSAVFEASRVRYLAGRQTQWHLVR